jgi:CheY-like chemotaxis protein
MHWLVLGSEAVRRVLQMHVRSARARLWSRAAKNESVERSYNVHTAAHFCMADPRSIRHIKAMRELYARISSQRVLCIDNNPYFREFVCWFVSDVGCEVWAAPNAGEAIALIRRNPSQYDLLILADWLPDMDGVELLRQLQAAAYSSRVVVTTARELRAEQRKMYESLGVSSIIVTPIGYAELMRILEQVASSVERRIPEKETFRESFDASTR